MEINTTPTAKYEYAIELRHVTKQFRIRHQGSLKRAILGAFKPKRIELFTALQDVSFAIPHGQTVAVIGKNGSGKSTLLALLARIYRANSGEVILQNHQGDRPQIAPLLELGAGFHLDLTGLENIQFYGALLGMTQQSLESKLDSIIEFSELKDKVDTPLRNWNDGAKLRLGFSIAVHTDLDILLVDEVLAVGDESFRNKCSLKIKEMQNSGKTIVFITHELTAAERIASRIIWLSQGAIRMDGDTASVLEAYRQASREGTI